MPMDPKTSMASPIHKLEQDLHNLGSSEPGGRRGTFTKKNLNISIPNEDEGAVSDSNEEDYFEAIDDDNEHQEEIDFSSGPEKVRSGGSIVTTDPLLGLSL